ncbi:zincin-like metallopeptidase domain-containing protein [Aliivibrio fischeri]|uniref:Uncharacterized protein n=1 Tax=Aliivibrio fischeri TaxID=668 RepID=A0A510UP51_ALIFS|nr:zincin-like metallopeptidase domain-containing protein [Aliivibrio fischeri]GEK16246.1 hypothetical protein AFI02nite_42820 [Aliivibrio fischeri]
MKGQKGTTIVYYKNLEKEDEEGNKEIIPMLRTFTVFNIDQVENIEKPMITVKETREKSEFVKLSYAEEAIHNIEIKINHYGVRDFYSPAHDEITLLMVDRFNFSSDYYATAWHELVHATGHKSCLDGGVAKNLVSAQNPFFLD